MSDKILRVSDADILYSNLNEKITDVSTVVNTKIDNAVVEDGYLILSANGNEVTRLTGFGGSGSGGGGVSNNAQFNLKSNMSWNAKTFSQGTKIPIDFYWSSIEGGNETGNGTLTVLVNNISKYTATIKQSTITNPNTVDVSSYLSAGTNIVSIQVADIYGNASSIRFTITIVAYKISVVSFSDNTVISAPTDIQFIATGSGNKTVYFDVDDKNVGTMIVTTSGDTSIFNLDLSGFEHGSHTLKVYYTVQLDEDNTVTSNVLTYSIIYSTGANDPVISCNYSGDSVNQYEKLSLTFTVYDPQNSRPTVRVYVDGVLNQTFNNVSSATTWSYQILNGNPDGTEDPYNIKVRIETGETGRLGYKEFTIQVIPSSIKIEAQTANMSVYFSAKNRSNSEIATDRIKWEYTDYENNLLSASLTGFNWSSNGWMTDDDGNPVLRLSSGAKVVIPYKIFSRDYADAKMIKRTGKTIEFEFATRDVSDYDANIINCIYDNIGIKITAQSALFGWSGGTIETQYKEDDHVRISFVITPGYNEDDDYLIYCYINGIIASLNIYKSSESFSQAESQDITIYSDEATVDIYNIRVYDFALNRGQIVNNWIADKTDYEEMVEAYNNNNVFDSDSNINPNMLPDFLPYMILNIYTATDTDGVAITDSTKWLPPSKGEKRIITGEYVDKAYPEKSFTFTKCTIDIQGTSSQEYPVKNYKLKIKNFIPSSTNDSYFKKKDGKYTKYKLRSNSVPESTFTIKADYASSEGANNVELVRFYNDTCASYAYKTPAQESDTDVTKVSHRQGIDGFPMVVFTRSEEGGDPVFLGKYNFNNDKGDEDTFGFDYHGKEYEEVEDEAGNVVEIKESHQGYPDESWEEGDNNGQYNRWVDFPTGTNVEVINKLLSSSGTVDAAFEVRFPSEWQDAHDGSYTEIADTSRFVNLLKWVSSTDTFDYDSSKHPRGIKYHYVKLSDVLPSGISVKAGDDVSEYYVKNDDGTYSQASIAELGVDYYKKEGEILANYPISFGEEKYSKVSGIEVGVTPVTDYYEYDPDIENSDGTIGKYIKSIGDSNGLAQSAVTYYSKDTSEYYYDNKDYRLSKFKSELSHYFNVQDTLFYYIFTEMFLMIDSRVKNSFPTYFAKVNETAIEWETKNVYSQAEGQVDSSITYYADENGTELESQPEEGTDASSYYIVSGTEYVLDKDGNKKPTDYSYEEVKDSNGWPTGRWCWLPYDMDTAIGINNQGKIAFSYNLEDTDHLTNGKIDENGTTEVFNGQDSVMWNNVRQCYSVELKNLYTTLRAGSFQYDTIEQQFEDHQNKWPAKVFNEDAYVKYVKPYKEDGEDRLFMCLGSKEQQRKWWMSNRFRYLDSKYTAGDSSKRIIFRSYNKGYGELRIKPYSDIYVRLRIGRSLDVNIRGARNQFTSIINDVIDPNNTETYIYSADQIKEVQGLNEFGIGNLSLTNATKLQKFACDGFSHNTSDGGVANNYYNGEFDVMNFVNCPLVTYVSAKDNIAFANDPDFENCKNLSYVNLLNTVVKSITFPNGGVLKDLYLPSTLTTLHLRNQQLLDNLHIMRVASDEEYNSTEEKDRYQDIVNCNDIQYMDGKEDAIYKNYIEDHSSLTSLLIVDCTDNLQEKVLSILYNMKKGSYFRLDGFNYTFNTIEDLNTFITTCRDTTLYGFLTAEGQETNERNGLVGTVTGTIELDYEYVREIIEDTAEGKRNLPELTFNYPIKKTVKFYNGDALLTTKYVTSQGFESTEVTYDLIKPMKEDVAPTTDADYTVSGRTGKHYTFAGWSTNPDATTPEYKLNNLTDWKELDAYKANETIDQVIDNITKDTVLYAIYIETPIYSVYFYDYRGVNTFYYKTIIGNGQISIDSIPESLYKVYVKTKSVEFIGWGTTAYESANVESSLDLKTLLNVTSSMNVYAIMDWPITSMLVREDTELENKYYYAGDKLDTTGLVIDVINTVLDKNNTEQTYQSNKFNSTGNLKAIFDSSVPAFDDNGDIILEKDTRQITLNLKDLSVSFDVGVANSLSVETTDEYKKHWVYGTETNPDYTWNPVGLNISTVYLYGEDNIEYTDNLIYIDSKETFDNNFTTDTTEIEESGENTIVISSKKDSSVTGNATAYKIPEADRVLEKNSWKTISEITILGMAEQFWAVGDGETGVKTLDFKPESSTYNDYHGLEDLKVHILGFNHNADLETPGKNTITFGLYTSKNTNNHTNKYVLSAGDIMPFDPKTREGIGDDPEEGAERLTTFIYSDKVPMIDNSLYFTMTKNCNDFYKKLSTDLIKYIIPVDKYQSSIDITFGEIVNRMKGPNYGTNKSDKHVETVYCNTVSKIKYGTFDEDGNVVVSPIFILSSTEIFGTNTTTENNLVNEGDYCKQYTYFSGVDKNISVVSDLESALGDSVLTNVNANAGRIKEDYTLGSNSNYWLRSMDRIVTNDSVNSPVFNYHLGLVYTENIDISTDSSITKRTYCGFMPKAATSYNVNCIANWYGYGGFVPCFVIGG